MEALAIDYAARLDPFAEFAEFTPNPTSTYVTHPLGGPAGGTFTEVAFMTGALATLPDDPAERDRVIDEVTRRLAVDLYGTKWAFTYRPDQYADAIARHGMIRRERVLVTRVEVYS